MEKKVIKKKLALCKETVAHLEAGDLAKAVGGFLSEIDFSYCYCSENCPKEH